MSRVDSSSFRSRGRALRKRESVARGISEIKTELPCGQLPVLEVDGTVVGQANAIARYLARKFGYYGSDEMESFKIDALTKALRDYWGGYWVNWTLEKGTDPAAVKAFIETASPKYLGIMEKTLEKNGGKFLVGDKLSLADIMLFNHVQYFEGMTGQKLSEGYPAVQKLVKDVGSLPRIQKWIETRPDDAA